MLLLRNRGDNKIYRLPGVHILDLDQVDVSTKRHIRIIESIFTSSISYYIGSHVVKYCYCPRRSIGEQFYTSFGHFPISYDHHLAPFDGEILKKLKFFTIALYLQSTINRDVDTASIYAHFAMAIFSSANSVGNDNIYLNTSQKSILVSSQ